MGAVSESAEVSGGVNVLFCFIGGDLEEESGAASEDIKEILQAETPKNVHVYVMTGGCRRWEFSPELDNAVTYSRIDNGDLIIEHSEQQGSCTDTAALASWLKYIEEKNTANKNILVFWGHGVKNPLGIGYDQLQDYDLSEEDDGFGVNNLPEIDYVQLQGDDILQVSEIRDGIIESGMDVGIIGFDACDMAGEDLYSALEGCCEWVIASEGNEDLRGWPQKQWLETVSSDLEQTASRMEAAINDDFLRRGRENSVTAKEVSIE